MTEEGVTPCTMYVFPNQQRRNHEIMGRIRELDSLKKSIIMKDTTATTADKSSLPEALELALLEFWIERMQKLRADELSSLRRQRMRASPWPAGLTDGHSAMHASLTLAAETGSIDEFFETWFADSKHTRARYARSTELQRLDKLVAAIVRGYTRVFVTMNSHYYGEPLTPTPQEMYALAGRPLVWPTAYKMDYNTQDITDIQRRGEFAAMFSTWPELQLLWTIPNSEYAAHVLTLKMMGVRLWEKFLGRMTREEDKFFVLGVDMDTLAKAWLRRLPSP